MAIVRCFVLSLVSLLCCVAHGQAVPYAATIVDPSSGASHNITVTLDNRGSTVTQAYNFSGYPFVVPSTISLKFDQNSNPSVSIFTYTIQPAMGVAMILPIFTLANQTKSTSSSYAPIPPWLTGQNVDWNEMVYMTADLNVHYKEWVPYPGYPGGGYWSGALQMTWPVSQTVYNQLKFTIN